MTRPMPPISSSDACVVVPVVPVAEVVLVPVDVAVKSTGLAVSTPLYCVTTAAARVAAVRLIVIKVAAEETFGAYQISVVDPVAFVADAVPARVQVAPVWVIPETLFAVVLRVEMTAINVLPFTGVAGIVTVKEVAVVVAVEPTPLLILVAAPALCTKIAENRKNDTNNVSNGMIVRIA